MTSDRANRSELHAVSSADGMGSGGGSGSEAKYFQALATPPPSEASASGGPSEDVHPQEPARSPQVEISGPRSVPPTPNGHRHGDQKRRDPRAKKRHAHSANGKPVQKKSLSFRRPENAPTVDPHLDAKAPDDQPRTGVQGIVKWFDDRRGFGFILPAEGGRQVFVHQSAIVAEGFRTLLQGQEVTFDLVPSDRGATAMNVVIRTEGAAGSGAAAKESRDWFSEAFGTGDSRS